MRYAILCYRDERVIDAACRTEEADRARDMARLIGEHIARGTIGASVRLLATTTSTTLRLLRGAPLILDVPAFETGGQLQSLYLVDCSGLEEALAVAGTFARIEPGGAYEVRPVAEILAPKQCGMSHGRD